ncbi:MAG: hypothetical protein IKY82_03540 [Alistipes sp.]|nr:hypothetical protein [Alistipes sp.]
MRLQLGIFIALASVCVASCAPQQGAVIRKKGDGFELRVDGEKSYIRGVGGTNRLDVASSSGANACRTWGGDVESVKRTSELAAKNGMRVMQGIWLPKELEKYSDEEFKNGMRQTCRELAETFKDDPNILCWGIGNEIELSGSNGAVVWSFVEELAAMMKSIDKRHLVSTVIAHNKSALDSIARYAPSLDIVGINSYGSIFQVKDMVAESDYKGPYMITEWGPTGWWETSSTAWKAPIEQTSEQKRQVYEERYNNAILGDKRCLGSFVFLWGQKEERTPTWFSMFVEGRVKGLPLKGEKTPMVEAMQRVWTGVEPEQTAPVVTGIKVNGLAPVESPVVAKGKSFRVEVAAKDREEENLTYIWEVLYEATKLGFGGSYEPRPERYGEVFTTTEPVADITIDVEGNFRVYAYVADGTGFVSTVNSPVQVQK